METVRLPDGRRLQVSNEGPTGNWVARIVGADGSPVAGRWLLRVLGDLLDLPHGPKPEWVLDLVRQLEGCNTAAGRRYPCPCCDFLTLIEPPTGTFAICPVCRWEDDNIQCEDVDYAGGANGVSLRQARDNFRLHGRSDVRRRGDVRPPLPVERPEPAQEREQRE
jgi:hypothetical protein